MCVSYGGWPLHAAEPFRALHTTQSARKANVRSWADVLQSWVLAFPSALLILVPKGDELGLSTRGEGPQEELHCLLAILHW